MSAKANQTAPTLIKCAGFAHISLPLQKHGRIMNSCRQVNKEHYNEVEECRLEMLRFEG